MEDPPARAALPDCFALLAARVGAKPYGYVGKKIFSLPPYLFTCLPVYLPTSSLPLLPVYLLP